MPAKDYVSVIISCAAFFLAQGMVPGSDRLTSTRLVRLAQLCDLHETVSPPSLRERTSDRTTSQNSHCQLCQVGSVDRSSRLFAMTSD